MTEANPVSTPANIEVKLQKNDGQSKEVDPVNYQSMVGSAAVETRPDIAQAVGVDTKYNSQSTEAHLIAVKRIIKYLKGAINLAIRMRKRH